MGHFFEALTLGILFGLGPCTAFCAPILMPLIFSTAKSAKTGFIQTVTFYSGKISSYIFLGLVSGYLGHSFEGFITSKIIGGVLIGLGIFLLLNLLPKKYPEKCQFLEKIDSKHFFFFTGLLVGLRPCPPLLAFLSLGILARSAFMGGLVGFFFGLGTLLSPLLVLGFLAGRWAEFSQKFRQINILIGGLFLIALGLWKIITYLSLDLV